MQKYIKPLVIWFIIVGIVTRAETIKASYQVSYGVFGQIGTAKAVLTKEDAHYTIDIALAATGVAKVLSGGRKEKHHSEGIIKDGILISHLYEVIKEYRSIKIIKRYVIDSSQHKVYKTYLKYKHHTLIKKEQKILNFFTTDDLLTLYFNLDKQIIDKHHAGRYIFHAVGAEKQQGKVSVIIPDANALLDYMNDLGKGAAWYATVVIHQKIFMSKEGRLELAVGKDGITQKALLKDLILFGDIRAVRKE